MRRRTLLGLAGAGIAGLAGCGGGDDNTPDTTNTEPTTVPTTTPSTTTSTRVPTTSTTTPITTSATTTTRTTTTPTTTIAPTMTSRTYAPTTTTVTPEMADIIVAPDEDVGDYSSVQDAIDAVQLDSPTETVIFIHDGGYFEKLEVVERKLNVTLIGESAANTILEYDENADDALGTTESASVSVYGDGFSAHNVTFKNSAVPLAQKVALLAEADRMFLYNCRFESHQDTLYTRDSANRQYYLDCYIEGTTDFVFGDAAAVFDGCELYCLERASYVTAANTLNGEDLGLVFKHCRIDGEVDEESVYLGRPWGPYAQTVFADCYIGDVIRPEGWHNWDDPDKEDTVYYAECANRGPGYTPDQRVEWATILDEDRLGEFHHLFDEWDPLGHGE